jgi:hypothetical protein
VIIFLLLCGEEKVVLFSGCEISSGERASMVNLRGADMMLSKGKKVESED